MLLKNKHAVIFAANGQISQGVAVAMARNGATVHLSGHRKKELEEFAKELESHGTVGSVAVVDATNQKDVRDYVKERASGGNIDIAFNGIGGRPATLGYPARATESSIDDFMIPMNKIFRSQFLTTREAAIPMIEAGSGALLTLSSTLSGGAFPYMTNLAAASSAIQNMTYCLAAEFGPHGIRVNCVRGSAMPETRTIQETGAAHAELTQQEPGFGVPPLGRPITVAETANAAVYLASDNASGMTGQTLTVCAGQFPTTI